MITAQVEHPEQNLIDLSLLKAAIHLALQEESTKPIDVTVRLTNDSEVRQMNKNYRNEDHTTDVLSFTQDFIDPETGRRYLGDIIISVDRAIDQAQENNHTLNEECAFLAIHGTLHLLGYDHSEPREKEQMWRLQDALFQKLIDNYQEKSG